MTKSAIKTLINGIKALIPNPQVQSDYAENNSNSISYIKNRPFYKDEETGEIKQIEEEFIPPVSAENVYFDEDLSNDYDGAQTVEEGFKKVIERPWSYQSFEVNGQINDSIVPIGNNNSIFLGIDRKTRYLAKSENGINWFVDNSVVCPLPSNWNINYINSYYYKGIWYIYNSSQLYYSIDLKQWESSSSLFPGVVIGYLGEKDGDLYACTQINNSTFNVIRTKDGINWETEETLVGIIDGFSFDYIGHFTCNDNGFIFENNSYQIGFTQDLKTYQVTDQRGKNVPLRTVNNIFYFYYADAIYYSFNGWFWDVIGFWPVQSSNRTIAYNGKFYITYALNEVCFSYDFVNWKSVHKNLSDIDSDGRVFAIKNTILLDQRVVKKEYNPLGLAMVSDLEDIDISKDLETLRNELNSKVDEVVEDIQKQVNENYIILKDAVNGYHYIIQMREGKLTSFCRCASIQITKNPDKLIYTEGEIFDPTGMVVEAVAEDGTVFEINQYVYDNSALVAGQQIKIVYTEMSKDFETTVEITVKPFDPEVALVDFEYTKNDDGTYTITDWKGTYNGEKSTKLVIPNSSLIIV